MKTKTADSKGRIALGRDYANRPVIIERVSETEIRVIMARVIPEREAWLLENEAARASVLRGLKQARERHFVESPPDLGADLKAFEDDTD